MLLYLLPLTAQDRYNEETLAGMLIKGEWYDAMDYYATYKDSVGSDLIYHYYWAVMGTAFNKPDSAIASIKILLEQYSDMLDPSMPALFRGWLVYVYKNLGDYKNVLKEINSMVADSIISADRFSEWEAYCTEMQEYPKMEILNTGKRKAIRIKREDRAIIVCNARYSRCTFGVNTIFDTGNTFPFSMNKKMADSIGVRILKDSIDVLYNGEKRLMARGLIDSVRIGDLLIRNAIASVLYDTPKPDSSNHSMDCHYDDIIMGLPMIKQLNYLELDIPNNDIVIWLERKTSKAGKINMVVRFWGQETESLRLSSRLYGEGWQDTLEFNAFFDTGAESLDNCSLSVGSKFYQKHEQLFSYLIGNNKVEEELTFPCKEFPLSGKKIFIPKEIFLRIRGISDDVQNTAVILRWDDDDEFIPYMMEDGTVTCNFFKLFRKVTLDFYNMRLELE
jgi:hypothetical protein